MSCYKKRELKGFEQLSRQKVLEEEKNKQSRVNKSAHQKNQQSRVNRSTHQKNQQSRVSIIFTFIISIVWMDYECMDFNIIP